MSMTRRLGFSAMKCCWDSAVSDSIVTRVYSAAGHTRTATMLAPNARSPVPSSRASEPTLRSASRRRTGRVIRAAPFRLRYGR